MTYVFYEGLITKRDFLRLPGVVDIQENGEGRITLIVEPLFVKAYRDWFKMGNEGHQRTQLNLIVDIEPEE